MVRLHTNFGDITIELDAERAPDTAANFLEYVRSGFYDNTIFHRVIDGFMIQGGGFDTGMKQKATRAPVKNEAANGLKNENYTLAMARTSDPHSATAQFFINVSDNTFLNHTAPNGAGLGLCGLRSRRGRQGRGRSHPQGDDGIPRHAPGRARGRCRDPEGRRDLKAQDRRPFAAAG